MQVLHVSSYFFFCLLSFAVLSFVFYIYFFGEEDTRINSSKHNFNVGPNWYVKMAKTFCEAVFENRLKKQEQKLVQTLKVATMIVNVKVKVNVNMFVFMRKFGNMCLEQKLL